MRRKLTKFEARILRFTQWLDHGRFGKQTWISKRIQRAVLERAGWTKFRGLNIQQQPGKKRRLRKVVWK